MVPPIPTGGLEVPSDAGERAQVADPASAPFAVGEGWAARPLRGSLPVDERPGQGGKPTVTPVAMFAPVHLVTPEPPPRLLPSAEQADQRSVQSRQLAAVAATDGAPDPVQDRVDEVLAAASSLALATIEPADASYDFDEYGLLSPGDIEGSGNGLFPQPLQATLLSLKVRARLGAMVGNVTTSYPSSPDPALLVDELHGWWLRICGQTAWNRLQTYDPDALRFGRVPPSWATASLWEPTREELYAFSLAMAVWTTGLNEIAAWAAGGGTPALGQLLTVAYWRTVGEAAWGNFSQWPVLEPGARPYDYPFVPFPVEEPLFGVRVTRRQTWHRQGYARGELVRTVPLAPRESKRVSVKITRRTRTSRGFEELTSAESSTEQAATTRNSDEIVSTATEQLNIHADSEVGGGYGEFFHAKVSAGVAEDTGRSSKSTHSRLNEMMSKTSSRLRRDTKVTVTSETETGFEESTSSELTNPNDEVSVTYLYHRLQQLFWVYTEIDEVNSVVLVPEALPAWRDIDEQWIRDNADALDRALLDDRYRTVLDAVTSEPPDLSYTATSVFSDAAKAGMNATADYKSFPGGSMPDVLASGQAQFAQDYERRIGLEMDAKRRKHQAAGLVAHVRRNILHYLRSVWSAEDYDQRIQRHGRRMVPTAWVFVPAGPAPPGATPAEVAGTFVPDPASLRPLSDVIDPMGPIGWLFNCAIYRLRDDPKLINLHQALAFLRSAYARFAVTVTPSANAGVTVRQHVAYAPRRFADQFALEWDTTAGSWLVSRPGIAGTSPAGPLVDGALDVRGVRLWIDGTPAQGDRIDVELRITAEVEDPHLRLLQLTNPLPAPGAEAGVFTAALVADMARLLPEAGLPANGAGGWAGLDVPTRALVRAAYHRYLLRRETGRRVTVDTANLLIEVEVSRGAALEPFKRLHRYIDVLKEDEERRRRHLDNERRSKLLSKDRLGDPDIEAVTVVSEAAEDLTTVEPPEQ